MKNCVPCDLFEMKIGLIHCENIKWKHSDSLSFPERFCESAFKIK